MGVNGALDRSCLCALSCKNDEQHMLVFESKSDF